MDNPTNADTDVTEKCKETSTQQQKNDNSSESAGLARGALRWRIQQVAKVSERLSTGLDAAHSVVDTNQTSYHSTNSTKDRTKKSYESIINRSWNKKAVEYARRVVTFSGNLVKHTIIGAAVFESYEQTINATSSFYKTKGSFDDYRLGCTHQTSSIEGNDTHNHTDVSKHFVAGACAGTVHSVLSLTVQSLQSFHSNRNSGTRYRYNFLFPSNVIPHMTHHIVTHSIMFGTYEYTKRMIIPIFGKTSFVDDSDDPDNSSVFYQEMIAVGIAGGLAGQAQHVVSNFTEAWLGVDGEGVTTKQGPKNNECGYGVRSGEMKAHAAFQKYTRNDVWSSLRILFRSMPSLRSIAVSFPPSAIAFVAYEYGKELVTFE